MTAFIYVLESSWFLFFPNNSVFIVFSWKSNLFTLVHPWIIASAFNKSYSLSWYHRQKKLFRFKECFDLSFRKIRKLLNALINFKILLSLKFLYKYSNWLQCYIFQHPHHMLKFWSQIYPKLNEDPLNFFLVCTFIKINMLKHYLAL